MRLATWVCAALTAGLLAGAALAQDFPLMTFGQLAVLDEKLVAEQKVTPRPGALMFNPGENGGSRTRAVFAGASRPLDPRKQAFIAAFASSSVGNDRYASLYAREYLFKAGGQDYWLPVQAQVASYFERELKPGQPVTLYLRNAGGFRGSDAWEWMFLVEEFDGGAASKTPPPAPGKKGPAIPPGPKTAV